MKTIKRIVFTGGPCSGKTTFVARAEEIFAERGYRVIIDHESATDLITGGISPATLGMNEFQKYCMKLQLEKEALCYKAAEEIEGDKVLIFIDRGILDDEGFVEDGVFEDLIKDFGYTKDKLLDRYDLVVHLVTSAKGAEEAYTFANNAARYESIEDARRVDDKILKSWEDHPHRVIIENEKDFEVKIIKAVQAVTAYLGEEKPVDIFRDFLVDLTPEIIEKIKNEKRCSYTHIYQHYLKSVSGTEKRIRKRIKDGQITYSYSETQPIGPGERIKRDRMLSEGQYVDYTVEIDNTLNPIDKERYSFFYNNRFCKLDIFNFDKTKGVLAVQLPSKEEDCKLPEYINNIKEITGVLNYKNYYLAKTQKF